MNAKQYLEQVKKIDKIIFNKQSEIEQWKTIAESITVPIIERVQTSGNPQKMAEAVHRIVEIQNDISECINRYSSIKMDIIKTIEILPAEEYDLLHKVYIGRTINAKLPGSSKPEKITEYMTLKEYASMKNRTYNWATVVYGRALRNVQRELDKRNTS